MPTLQLAALLSVLSFHTTQVAAQDNTEDSLPLTDDPTDPIGIERDPFVGHAAAPSGNARPALRSARERDEHGPEPPVLTAQAGEVLTAAASVRERAHHTTVELTAGLALIHTELEFENAGEKPAEVAYRLAVPADAALFGLEVCNPRGCRPGLKDNSEGRLNAYDDAVLARGPARASGLPAADARVVRDVRGSAVRLRAAAVVRGQSLRVRIDYVAQASAHAGVVRLSLPARGMDPRAAPTSLQLEGRDASALHVNELPVTPG
ncbi:MAG: hypothetical protein ABW321_31295, partial [Polyangiales bacterium]